MCTKSAICRLWCVYVCKCVTVCVYEQSVITWRHVWLWILLWLLLLLLLSSVAFNRFRQIKLEYCIMCTMHAHTGAYVHVCVKCVGFNCVFSFRFICSFVHSLLLLLSLYENVWQLDSQNSVWIPVHCQNCTLNCTVYTFTSWVCVCFVSDLDVLLF